MMKNMEEHKYLPPKFSDCLRNLADIVGIDFEFYEKQILTTRCDTTIDFSKERQQTIQDTQTTPPRGIKSKINSLNSSVIKSWKTPNTSPPRRKRQNSNESSQQQNKRTFSQEKLEEKKATINIDEVKYKEPFSVYPNVRINSEQQNYKRDEQRYSLRNSDKPYEGKHRELISRVQKNIQTVQMLQQSDYSKLTNSSYNPFINNYSPPTDILKKGNKKIIKLDNQGYSTNWPMSVTVSNSPTNYSKNIFMYENQNDNLKKYKTNSNLNSPNIYDSFEESIKTIKKPNNKHKGKDRNYSVDINIVNKNNSHNINCNNSIQEQGSITGSEIKQVKNIRLKKQKINTKEDSSQIVKTQKDDIEDSTGITVFNSALKYICIGNKIVQYSPKNKNTQINEELQGLIEGSLIYKEKETLNLTNINVKSPDNQKLKLQDILQPEESSENKDEDKKEQHS